MTSASGLTLEVRRGPAAGSGAGAALCVCAGTSATHSTHRPRGLLPPDVSNPSPHVLVAFSLAFLSPLLLFLLLSPAPVLPPSPISAASSVVRGVMFLGIFCHNRDTQLFLDSKLSSITDNKSSFLHFCSQCQIFWLFSLQRVQVIAGGAVGWPARLLPQQQCGIKYSLGSWWPDCHSGGGARICNSSLGSCEQTGESQGPGGDEMWKTFGYCHVPRSS